jgi:hypothetical protein
MGNNEVFEIDFTTEKGKEMMRLIQGRIEILVKNPIIQDELAKMHNAGKEKEQCRTWITLLAITSLYGLPKAGANERCNYLAGKLRDLAMECKEG